MNKTNNRSFKHGLSQTRIYDIYINIVDRCYDKNNNSYHYYGGRGIGLDDAWRNRPGEYNGLLQFVEDMKPLFDEFELNNPTLISSIDRIDVNGNYSKSNCRVIDSSKQGRNKRNNVFTEDLIKLLNYDYDINGFSTALLMIRYNTSKQTILKILKHKIAWKDVDECESLDEYHQIFTDNINVLHYNQPLPRDLVQGIRNILLKYDINKTIKNPVDNVLFASRYNIDKSHVSKIRHNKVQTKYDYSRIKTIYDYIYYLYAIRDSISIERFPEDIILKFNLFKNVKIVKDSYYLHKLSKEEIINNSNNLTDVIFDKIINNNILPNYEPFKFIRDDFDVKLYDDD